jgi:hypothetical protein
VFLHQPLTNIMTALRMQSKVLRALVIGIVLLGLVVEGARPSANAGPTGMWGMRNVASSSDEEEDDEACEFAFFRATTPEEVARVGLVEPSYLVKKQQQQQQESSDWSELESLEASTKLCSNKSIYRAT